MDEILKFKNLLKRKKITGLALDIDNTLSSTNYYWVKKLTLMFGNPENLTIEQIITKYQYASNVPYWQTKNALQWMEGARLDNKLHEELPLIENANLIVQKINKIIPIVIYLTVRPTSVLSTTKNWLKKHRFPLAEVIAKPLNISFQEGNKWKAEILNFLYPQIIGIIDDNPEIIDYLPVSYKGIVYLYNINQAPKKSFKVISCRNWKEVWLKVKQY